MRRTHCGLFLLTIALGLGVPARALGGGDRGGARPLIVYGRRPSGPWGRSGLFSVLGDGTETNVTYHSGVHTAPRISPDGRHILFNSTEGGEIGVWLIDGRTYARRRVCDGDQAEWSPDSGRIVFRRMGAILERDLGSGRERRLTPRNWQGSRFPSYFPDGRRVLCVAGSDRDAHLAVLRPGGRPETCRVGYVPTAPKPSPDGARIACQIGPHIYVLSVDGRSRRQLTTAGGVQCWPTWSTDGKHVGYCQFERADWDRPGANCDYYAASLTEPGTVVRLKRKINVNPGWGGVVESGARRIRAAGKTLEVLERTGSAGRAAAAPIGEAHGWRLLQTGRLPHSLTGTLAVRNDWGSVLFDLQERTVLLVPRLDREGAVPVELAVGPGTGLGGAAIVARDADSLTVRAACGAGAGQEQTFLFRILRTRPTIEIRASAARAADAQLLVRAACPHIVLPDPLADDLVLTVAGLIGARGPRARSAHAIPKSPLILCSPDCWGGDAMLVISCAQAEQASVFGGAGRAFAGVRIRASRGRPVYVAILPGKKIWHVAQLAPDAEKGKLGFRWRHPFPAQYRIAAWGPRAWRTSVYAEKKAPKFVSVADAGSGDRLTGAVVYFGDRTQYTDPAVLTPTDLLVDIYGCEAGRALLTHAGVASKDHEAWLLKNVVRNSYWAGRCMVGRARWPVPLMRSIVRDSKDLFESYDRQIADATSFLRALDRRRQRLQAKPATRRFAAQLKTALGELTLQPPRRTTADLDRAAAAVLEHMQTDPFAKTRDGRSATAKEFRRLWKALRLIGQEGRTERWRILAKLEDTVRNVRNTVRWCIATGSGPAAEAEAIAERAGNVLAQKHWTRNIYFDSHDFAFSMTPKKEGK